MLNAEIEKQLAGITRHTRHAVGKHPLFIPDGFTGTPLSLLMEEIGEACTAINEGDLDLARYELRDAGAVLVRWLHMLDNGDE